jgi:hypothetical protein
MEPFSSVLTLAVQLLAVHLHDISFAVKMNAMPFASGLRGRLMMIFLNDLRK